MIRLLLVDRYFYPDLQATSVLLSDLASELSKDFQVEVLAGPPSSFRTEVRNPNLGKVHVQTLSATDFSKKIFIGRVVNYISFLLAAFFTFLFSERPDVVICQTSPPLLPFIISCVCRVRGIPYIYVCQDMFPETAIASQRLNSKFLGVFFKRLNKIAMQHANSIVAIGRDMIDHLIQYGIAAEKIKFISNWSNPEEIRVEQVQSEFSKKNNFAPFILLYSGNFGYLQDFKRVLDLAFELKTERDIQFVFVGGGGLFEEVKTISNSQNLPNVKFFPYQPRESLSDVLASANLHVISLRSNAAGFLVPSKIYSLLASGRPMIGLMEKHSEAARVIEEANCGVVFEKESAKEIADRIRGLTMNKVQLEAWGRNGRAYLEKTNPRQQAFKNYKELILAAVQK